MGVLRDLILVALHLGTAIVFVPNRFLTYWMYTRGIETWGDNAMTRLREKHVMREEELRKSPQELNTDRRVHTQAREQKIRDGVDPTAGGKVVGRIGGGVRRPLTQKVASGSSDAGFRDFIPQNEPPPDRRA
ncbi:MAG: hypothetical protein O2794_03790 [bacterium]|nr:hypothetical protein [bacterium]